MLVVQVGSRARWNKWNDCAARSSVCRQCNQRSLTHKDTICTYAHDEATFQMHARTTALMQTFLHTRMQTTLVHTYVFICDSRSVSFTCALQVPPSHQQTETCVLSSQRVAAPFVSLRFRISVIYCEHKSGDADSQGNYSRCRFRWGLHPAGSATT